MTSCLSRCRAAAVLAFFIGLFAIANAAPVKFNIPAQPAPAALQLFIKQSGTQVMFVEDEVKDVMSKPVTGDHEPMAALRLLLQGTGYTVTERKAGWFAVVRESTGGVRGALTLPGGGPAAGVLVVIRETGQSAETDKDGQFFFSTVAPGSHLLVVRAEGYQPLHITDVVVKSGHEVALSRETLRKPADGVTVLEPFTVRGDPLTELDKFAVTGSKQKPFASGNMDVPRTINDVQPYYIFSGDVIERSGAVNLEDFLKKRLPMNGTTRTSSDGNGAYVGTTSSVNLRGLGADLTLVLVNGRRAAGVSYQGLEAQPDLNGIPFSLVERVEVLPASASGIYGGKAIGGVVNVILKKDFSGGEIRLGYDNTFETDTAKRNASLTYGLTLEGGRTKVLLSASWADGNFMLAQDRQRVFSDKALLLLRNYPAIFASGTTPLLASLPNITATSAAVTTLTLRNGQALGSPRTHIAAGTSSSTSTADLYASLLANAGKWNTEPPPTGQFYLGTKRLFITPAQTNSVMVRLDRKMTPWLDLFLDLSRMQNSSPSPSYSTVPVTVAATSPVNPFTTAVRLSLPIDGEGTQDSRTVAMQGTLGGIVHLPHDWSLELEFSPSVTRLKGYTESFSDTTGMATDINAGRLNPFVDLLKFPLDLQKYYTRDDWEDHSRLMNWAVRGAGPSPAMPWGAAQVNFVLERREWAATYSHRDNVFPSNPSSTNYVIGYPLESRADSAYVETSIPLMKKGWKPLLYAFELHFTGRTEHYTVDAGTMSKTVFPNSPPFPQVFFNGPTLNGEPFATKASFDSTNYNAGFRYQPTAGLTLRASTGTAFLPPGNSQLARNTTPSTTPTNVTDPKTGTTVPVFTLGGGNPGVKPQNAEDRSVGIIWQPVAGLMQGLRIGLDYRETDQFDAIGSLNAQQIVNNEALFPERVTRNADGVITLVETSSLNLYKRESREFVMQVDYSRKIPIGTVEVSSHTNLTRHNRRQLALTTPMYDYAGFNTAEGGQPKTRSNLTVVLDRSRWNVGWTTMYVGSYKAYGAPGSPLSLQSANGGIASFYITAMGGKTTIEPQAYHDVFATYKFPRTRASSGPGEFRLAGLLSGVSVQVGIRNVFDKIPPLDASPDVLSYGYLSSFGDLRLRSYWLTFKKAF